MFGLMGWMLVGGATSAHATEIGNGRDFGLGLVLGAPSGITGKYYLGGRRNAIDAAVGTWYSGRGYYGGWHVQAAYHFHIEELTSGSGVTIPLRVGIGGFVTDGGWGYTPYWGEVAVGARVPVGLDFDLENTPLQFFVEVAADVTIIPGIYIYPDAGIGGRYYF